MNCAEINSSFYRPHLPSTWTRWAQSVPDGFLFAVKAPKAITHEADLDPPPHLLPDFLAAVSHLGDRLGPLLFQLPPKLAFDDAVAKLFFTTLRKLHAGPVALEPRHASWFTREVVSMLEGLQIARVAADPARVPEAAVPGGWPGLVYYRLHGSPRIYYTSYGPKYLDSLAGVIRQRSSAQVWVVFDNTASGAAIHNALDLSALSRAALL